MLLFKSQILGGISRSSGLSLVLWDGPGPFSYLEPQRQGTCQSLLENSFTLTVRTSLLNCSRFSQKPSSGWTRFQQAETLLFHRMKGSQGLPCSLGWEEGTGRAGTAMRLKAKGRPKEAEERGKVKPLRHTRTPVRAVTAMDHCSRASSCLCSASAAILPLLAFRL